MKRFLILLLALSLLFVSSASAVTSRKVTDGNPVETDTISLNLDRGMQYSIIGGYDDGYIYSFHVNDYDSFMYYFPAPEDLGLHVPVPGCSMEEFRAFILADSNHISVGNIPEEDVRFWEMTFAGEKCYAWEASYTNENGYLFCERQIYRIGTMDYFSIDTFIDDKLEEMTGWIESILTWKAVQE